MTARNSGVLSLQRDFNPTKLDRVKHSVARTLGNGSSKTSVEIPKLSIGASRMELISFLTEFRCSDDMMLWTTGPAGLYKKFTIHLQVTDLDAWNIFTTNMPQTVVGLHRCIKSLKTSRFLDNSYDKQVEFLRSIKKPRDLEPRALNALLSFHNVMLADLPGAP
jgi:hypothetical protein